VPAQPDEIWDAIRTELRRETPDFKFHIWLDPLRLAAIRGRTVYVRAPEHIRTSVAERYLPLLRRAAAAGFDAQALVEIVGEGWEAPADGGAASGAGGSSTGSTRTAGEPSERRGDRLNPKYTFEQFVIGAGNRFAHAAALAAAELPGHSYNPLFLHGSPGIGKTHLLHAIGNYVERFGSGLRVRYATIEEFTSEFVEAVRKNRTAEFKQSFRGADVVLIDDVQFLAGRDRTREEFFHTFNSLLDAGRQLVMTSDRAPEDIPGIEERLIERFRSGLVAELETPEVGVRMAILAKRARLDGVDVAPDVIHEIATRVTTSVRALEGALIRVVAYASMNEKDPTPELVRHVLRRLKVDETTDARSMNEIVEATAQEFGLEPDDLRGKSRQQSVTAARHVAMYLAKELTRHSPSEIGEAIGGRDRKTVTHGITRATEALQSDQLMRSSVNNLRRRLAQPA
jgi:chromosomal replication initiator protein